MQADTSKETKLPDYPDEHDSSLDQEDYDAEIRILQARLAAAVDRLGSKSWVFVFEGRDTAGKTGTIQRMMEGKKMDQDRVSYNHHSAPTLKDEKKAQRDMGYWKLQLPKSGRVVFFDRSWYSTVLGLKVNSPGAMDWNKQYQAINAFETQLALNGTGITKFFLDISKPEQFRRVQRRKTGPKDERKKYSPNDDRSYFLFAPYTRAIGTMLDKTGTPMAPWYLVDMNDKWRGRLKIMETAAALLEGSAPWPVQQDIIRVPGVFKA